MGLLSTSILLKEANKDGRIKKYMICFVHHICNGWREDFAYQKRKPL